MGGLKWICPSLRDDVLDEARRVIKVCLNVLDGCAKCIADQSYVVVILHPTRLPPDTRLAHIYSNLPRIHPPPASRILRRPVQHQFPIGYRCN